MRISPADVGRRVAVRRVLDDGRDGLGDVVGDLLAWADGTLTVRTRDGRDVRIAERLLVSGKTVPAAPARARHQ